MRPLGRNRIARAWRRLPGVESRDEIRFLDEAECEAIVRHAERGDYMAPDRAFYVTAFGAGLRHGELCALRIMDVDQLAGRIRVRRNWVLGEEGTPKSRRSTRSVPMTDRVAGELDLLVKARGKLAPDALVFADPLTGGPMARRRRSRKEPAERRVLLTLGSEGAGSVPGVVKEDFMKRVTLGFAAVALVAASVAVVATLALAASASAAPWEPPKPKKSHYGFKWVQYGCGYANGVERAGGRADAYVYKLAKGWRGTGMFYQKIKVQVDYHGGFNGSSPMWRKISAQTGVKEDANGDKTYFQKSSGLPDSTSYGYSVGNFPAFTDLTVKVTVWLKRYGSPKAVWRYRKRSKPFQCNGATSQLPSINGGSPGGT